MKSNTIYGMIALMLTVPCGFCSCASKPSTENGDSGQNIRIDRITDKDLSEFFTEFDCLPLALPEGVVFGGIQKMLGTAERFYILDITQQSVFIFDKNGNFFQQIHRVGRGPNEYLKIDSFALDHQNKKLVISDAISRKILLFDFDGNFEKTIVASIPAYTVVPLGKGHFAHINDGIEEQISPDIKDYNITILKDDGRVQESFLTDQTPQRIAYSPQYNVKTLENGDFLYCPLFSNTIYRIAPSMSVEEHYNFTYDLDGYNVLDVSNLKNIRYEIMSERSTIFEYENRNYICPTGDFLDNEKYLFTAFGIRKRHFVYYDKETKQSLAVNCTVPPSLKLESASEQEMRRMIFSNLPLYIEDDMFYTHISSLALEVFTPRLELSGLKTVLQEMAAKGYGTPCLFRYKIDLSLGS